MQAVEHVVNIKNKNDINVSVSDIRGYKK